MTVPAEPEQPRPEQATNLVPVPSVAKVWNALLGGKDSRAVERELVERIRATKPDIADLANSVHRYKQRVADHLVRSARIDQFVDCGPGYPRLGENTHDIVQKFNLEARVLYVDQNPEVLAHGRALLAVNNRIGVLDADPNDLAMIREHQGSRAVIDWDRPVGVISTMPLVFADPERVDPAKTVQGWIPHLAVGSHLALGFFAVADGLETVAATIGAMFCSELHGGRFLPIPDIEAVFGELDLVGPGVALCDEWPPDLDEIEVGLNSIRRCAVAGVARVREPSHHTPSPPDSRNTHGYTIAE
ncbi:SAM-dependent methyltransferase [Kribbella sp. NPDC059898]|uniref:SAM-dependent methyltransferase n=1 Tax=Kribbella sp. NPDC059898 TaxID=3346995 RepID=UPI00365F3A27